MMLAHDDNGAVSAFSFFVPGRAETQGSVRAYPGKHGGAFVVQGGSKERRDRLADWRVAVRSGALEALEALALEGDQAVPWAGPVTVLAHFGLPKPSYMPKRKRRWPIGARAGDIDKLLRAVLDALTAVVWLDDSQVTGVVVTKDYDDRPGLSLVISREPLRPVVGPAGPRPELLIADV